MVFFLTTSHLLGAAPDTDKKQDPTQGSAPVPTQDTPDTRLNRIDFGNTYIIGQTIKSGAVYLLQRKKSEIKSMLRYREDYREEILDGFSVDAPSEPAKDQKQNQLSRRDRQGGDQQITKE